MESTWKKFKKQQSMANNEGLGLSAAFQNYTDARTLSWD